jgi:glycerol-3-phosphate acyltransferase PlsX
MRIGVDAMGGDKAPAEVVAGALQAIEQLDRDDRVVLIGQEEAVRPLLPETLPPQIEVVHAPDVISMDGAPVESLRAKPQSSIAVLSGMHKAGELEACVSAGNTGACVASAQMMLRRLPGVHRPGICATIPTLKNQVAICDVGANIDCRPQHLYQYGVMASVYMRRTLGVENPRVGLLSIGEEETKGNSLVKKTRDLLKEDKNINFIGNVEGRDLFRDACDVMVCEGFVGNVILKLVEGMGVGLMKGLMEQFITTMPDQLERMMQVAGKIKQRWDFNEHGGAPLLGVAGIWFICHGASSHVGIMNAILKAKSFGAHDVNPRVTELLSGS